MRTTHPFQCTLFYIAHVLFLFQTLMYTEVFIRYYINFFIYKCCFTASLPKTFITVLLMWRVLRLRLLSSARTQGKGTEGASGIQLRVSLLSVFLLSLGCPLRCSGFPTTWRVTCGGRSGWPVESGLTLFLINHIHILFGIVGIWIHSFLQLNSTKWQVGLSTSSERNLKRRLWSTKSLFLAPWKRSCTTFALPAFHPHQITGPQFPVLLVAQCEREVAFSR